MLVEEHNVVEYVTVLAEITQDIASKGLGLVYEKCSPEQKESLVSTLVGTLTTGRK